MHVDTYTYNMQFSSCLKITTTKEIHNFIHSIVRTCSVFFKIKYQFIYRDDAIIAIWITHISFNT